MLSKNQTRSLHGNKTKPHADLVRHYRQVGIKAVSAAARAGVRPFREDKRETKTFTEEEEMDE
jgi:hypothetical protein